MLLHLYIVPWESVLFFKTFIFGSCSYKHTLLRVQGRFQNREIQNTAKTLANWQMVLSIGFALAVEEQLGQEEELFLSRISVLDRVMPLRRRVPG